MHKPLSNEHTEHVRRLNKIYSCVALAIILLSVTSFSIKPSITGFAPVSNILTNQPLQYWWVYILIITIFSFMIYRINNRQFNTKQSSKLYKDIHSIDKKIIINAKSSYSNLTKLNPKNILKEMMTIKDLIPKISLPKSKKTPHKQLKNLRSQLKNINSSLSLELKKINPPKEEIVIVKDVLKQITRRTLEKSPNIDKIHKDIELLEHNITQEIIHRKAKLIKLNPKKTDKALKELKDIEKELKNIK